MPRFTFELFLFLTTHLSFSSSFNRVGKYTWFEHSKIIDKSTYPWLRHERPGRAGELCVLSHRSGCIFPQYKQVTSNTSHTLVSPLFDSPYRGDRFARFPFVTLRGLADYCLRRMNRTTKRERRYSVARANVRSRVIRYRLPNFYFSALLCHDGESQYCLTMEHGRRFAIKRAHSTWRLFFCTLTTINACCWLRRSSTIPGSESTGDTRYSVWRREIGASVSRAQHARLNAAAGLRLRPDTRASSSSRSHRRMFRWYSQTKTSTHGACLSVASVSPHYTLELFAFSNTWSFIGSLFDAIIYVKLADIRR